MDYLIDSKLNDNIVLVKEQFNKALRTFEYSLAPTGCRLQVRPLVGGKVLQYKIGMYEICVNRH